MPFANLTQPEVAHHKSVGVLALPWINIILLTDYHVFAICYTKIFRLGKATLQEHVVQLWWFSGKGQVGIERCSRSTSATGVEPEAREGQGRMRIRDEGDGTKVYEWRWQRGPRAIGASIFPGS